MRLFIGTMVMIFLSLSGWEEANMGGSYELHLVQEVRSRGLGRILVEIMEGFGKRVGVKKVMLTAFLENEGARRFYSRLGYVRDDFTPDDVVGRNGRVRKVAYEILSKGLKD